MPIPTHPVHGINFDIPERLATAKTVQTIPAINPAVKTKAIWKIQMSSETRTAATVLPKWVSGDRSAPAVSIRAGAEAGIGSGAEAGEAILLELYSWNRMISRVFFLSSPEASLGAPGERSAHTPGVYQLFPTFCRNDHGLPIRNCFAYEQSCNSCQPTFC